MGALRDIEPKEEIFLDYGEDWEAAWENHVKNWKPIKEQSSPLYHLNSAQEIKTEKEQIESPYPDDVMTVCFMKSSAANSKNQPVSWKRYAVYAEDASIGDSHKCKITNRTTKETSETLYAVVAEVEDEDEGTSTTVVANDVPRFAIEFVHRP